MDETADPTDETAASPITVYWRPGCPFCSSLRRGLRRAGVPTREVDIWSEPDARAFVRSVADGNETVPTVAIGAVTLVNPSVRQTLAVVRTELPTLDVEPARHNGWLSRLRRTT